jgi:hypothetical protein
MSTGVRCLVLLAALLVGCGGDDKPAPKNSSGPRLPVAPAAITNACAEAATPAAFPVLCPTRWPSPSGRGAPKARLFEEASDGYLINVENGFSRRGGHVFHLIVGGQAQPFGRWPAGVDPDLRVTTRKVTIPQRGGGRFVQQLPARRIATARVHGARAAVLQEPPYPTGGIHGGHVVVLWSEAGHGYLVSVHGERLSRDKLVTIALAMARSTSRYKPRLCDMEGPRGCE